MAACHLRPARARRRLSANPQRSCRTGGRCRQLEPAWGKRVSSTGHGAPRVGAVAAGPRLLAAHAAPSAARLAWRIALSPPAECFRQQSVYSRGACAQGLTVSSVRMMNFGESLCLCCGSCVCARA